MRYERTGRRTCEDNRDHPRAAELFDPNKLPAFHDPFAGGGGSIPLEAQRLGLEASCERPEPGGGAHQQGHDRDTAQGSLASRPSILEARKGQGFNRRTVWKGAAGLAEDVRYYGKWMRGEAEKRIGHLYPKIEVTAEMARERPDLKRYVGRRLTVIAWLWARTVKSPEPPPSPTWTFPLASAFVLSTKKGKEAYVEPVIENDAYRFARSRQVQASGECLRMARQSGSSGSAFLCLMSGVPSNL